MLTLLRRFVTMTALLFWQGGFLFYASVVVPVGQEVLRSHQAQGFLTQRVTNYLNLSGAVALTLFLCEGLAAKSSGRWSRRLRWLAWLGMTLTLVFLICYHPYLDQFLDSKEHEILDHRAFRQAHRIYLWVSTVQWGFGVVYYALTLMVWREEDSKK